MHKCIKCLNEIAEKSCPVCGSDSTLTSVFNGLFSFYNKLALKLQCCGKLLTAIAIILFALHIVVVFGKFAFDSLMILTLTMLWATWLSSVYHLFTKPSKLKLKDGKFARISHFEKADLPIRKYFIAFTTFYLSLLLVFTVVFVFLK